MIYNKFLEDKNNMQIDSKDLKVMEDLYIKRLDKENYSNSLMIKQKNGSILIYGDLIIFKHYTSGK